MLLDQKGTISFIVILFNTSGTVTVLGKMDTLSLPSSFTLNGKEIDIHTICSFDKSKSTLTFTFPEGVSLLEDFTMKWS